jgi:hypothetical protein
LIADPFELPFKMTRQAMAGFAMRRTVVGTARQAKRQHEVAGDAIGSGQPGGMPQMAFFWQ